MAATLNPMDLSGKTVMVTGASSGIGRDTCIVLSELGARVILVARDEQRLQETLNGMSGGDHLIRVFDVTKHAETASWMSGIAKEIGAIFALVHLAGISHTAALRFLDMNQLDQILDINLKSAFSLAHAFRQKSVREQPEARIVLTSSVSAIRGYPGMTSYAASKGGILAITPPLAVELARENIRVNCVTPGLVHTEMSLGIQTQRPADTWDAVVNAHPLGVGVPRNISLPIAFLLSPASAWMTGQCITIDGGLTIK